MWGLRHFEKVLPSRGPIGRIPEASSMIACAHIYIYIYIYVCICVHIYIYMCVCVCVWYVHCIILHIYIYTHIYIHWVADQQSEMDISCNFKLVLRRWSYELRHAQTTWGDSERMSSSLNLTSPLYIHQTALREKHGKTAGVVQK